MPLVRDQNKVSRHPRAREMEVGKGEWVYAGMGVLE